MQLVFASMFWSGSVSRSIEVSSNVCVYISISYYWFPLVFSLDMRHSEKPRNYIILDNRRDWVWTAITGSWSDWRRIPSSQWWSCLHVWRHSWHHRWIGTHLYHCDAQDDIWGHTQFRWRTPSPSCDVVLAKPGQSQLRGHEPSLFRSEACTKPRTPDITGDWPSPPHLHPHPHPHPHPQYPLSPIPIIPIPNVVPFISHSHP